MVILPKKEKRKEKEKRVIKYRASFLIGRGRAIIEKKWYTDNI